MRKSSIIRAAVPLGIASMLLAGCTAATPEEPDTSDTTIRVNWGGFPEGWGPGVDLEPGYARVPYETLLILDGAELKPNLATSWEEDGSTITLELRDDVMFHDGTAFDAEAVKTNIEVVRDTPNIFAGPMQVVDSVDVVDEHTVQINLDHPTPSFVSLLAARNVPILSPAAIEDGSINSTPVGTGPWAYDAAGSSEGTRMLFSRFDDYWGEMPPVANIELYAILEDSSAASALLNDEIDITDIEPESLPLLEGQPNIDSIDVDALRNNITFFDRAPGGVFGDVNVRRAMCAAIDRSIITGLDPSLVAQPQFMLDGMYGYNPDVEDYEFDLDQAAEYLAEAGNPSVVGTMIAAPFNEQQLTVYADQMSQLEGVDITVQPVPVPQFITDWYSGQYPLGVGGHDEMTPYDWYRGWFAADAPNNPAGYESDELKAAADAAIEAGGAPEAEVLWQEVLGIIADEALSCANVLVQQRVFFNTARVGGVQASLTPLEQNSIDYRALTPAG